MKEKLKGFRRASAAAIRQWLLGSPAMKLPPEVNLLAVSHYLQALEYQQKVNKVVAILGSNTTTSETRRSAVWPIRSTSTANLPST